MDPARLVGINHVALEVGSIEEALAFYGRFFELHLRGVVPGMAFIDMGDQFLALSEGREQGPDQGRHFGLVVDDKERVRAALQEAEVHIVPGQAAGLLRPLGQPDRDRRLPRHPVHEGAAGARGHGAGSWTSARRRSTSCARRACSNYTYRAAAAR